MSRPSVPRPSVPRMCRVQVFGSKGFLQSQTRTQMHPRMRRIPMPTPMRLCLAMRRTPELTMSRASYLTKARSRDEIRKSLIGMPSLCQGTPRCVSENPTRMSQEIRYTYQSVPLALENTAGGARSSHRENTAKKSYASAPNRNGNTQTLQFSRR